MSPVPDASTGLVPRALQVTLQKRIDEIGFGKFQVIMLLCTGGVMMSEGSEMLVMGSITRLLDKDWGLSNFVRGFMVSVVFIGFAIGNLISGAIGDRHGRRPTILLSYLVIGTGGFLTSMATSPAMMVGFRFLVGIGCGIGFPSIYSLIPEVCPTHLRGTVSALMIGFMPLGELFASVGVLLIDKDLEGLHELRRPLPLPAASWRRLCQFSAMPSLFFLTACLLLLQESPYYLARHGRIEEANAVLAAMASWNGKPAVPLEMAGTPAAPGTLEPKLSFSSAAAVRTVFGKRYFGTTLVMFMAHFTKDFSVFGLNYVFPQYFSDLSSPMPVGLEMLMISVIALPGVLVAVAITQTNLIGNITSLSLMAFLCGALAFGLLERAPVQLHSICACSVKFMALAYFIITVVYTAEVFPTSVRNSAVGLCTCCGRLGSISAPLAFELANGFDLFWYIIIVCMWTISLTALICLPYETKGQALVEDERLEDAGYLSAAKAGAMA